MNTFTSWYELEAFAQRENDNNLEFMAAFPSGSRKGRFLDAYMGLITFDGVDGFLTVRQLSEACPSTTCVVLNKD